MQMNAVLAAGALALGVIGMPVSTLAQEYVWSPAPYYDPSTEAQPPSTAVPPWRCSDQPSPASSHSAVAIWPRIVASRPGPRPRRDVGGVG